MNDSPSNINASTSDADIGKTRAVGGLPCSAEWHSAVSPNGIRRAHPLVMRLESSQPADFQSATQQSATLRYKTWRCSARGRSLPRFNFAFLCALIILAFGNLTTHAQVSREYQLKAVFLYNFAQFTDWPTDAFADDKAPIVIGVLGGDPFGTTLDDTVRGETVRGHPLMVEHYHHADEIKMCHILFISQPEIRHWDDIVKAMKGKAILTVADADGTASAKAVIRFAVENNKVHFRVNQDAAREENLTLSSKLLRVADATPPTKTP